ncbi:aminoacyl-tRNA deacylase [Streptacidiphilus sp. P02-A3a]|uniref:aminoacyl-tRNA deacylase n=1 Tax=Streptacidiphilus sp. P02-A3a TaxID=2704468 RepID=UPI0015FE3570|nr:aminoacyl-tRNA deacylase [Streptacidiphilus sp. P02-A3a]QMU68788.1 aminoacyl-tRNA deacylase [Streptacidiphilus sp. P02-A3a]
MAKKAKRGGQGTPATVALEAAGVRFSVHAYEHDPAAASYGEEASQALGVPAERVFKTLLADVDGALVVGVVPVAGQLDLKALAAAVGGKHAAMADPAAAERATGYVLGGISPLGHPAGRLCALDPGSPAELAARRGRRLATVLDATALDHPTVFVSAGRRGLEVELPPADLVALTAARTARIGRPC